MSIIFTGSLLIAQTDFHAFWRYYLEQQIFLEVYTRFNINDYNGFIHRL